MAVAALSIRPSCPPSSYRRPHHLSRTNPSSSAARHQKAGDMSWGSRFGSWASGAWSPFSRSASTEEVTDQDFSYITPEDLHKHESQSHSHTHDHNQHSHSRHSSLRPSSPRESTDVVIFRNKSVSYPVHFRGASIDDGSLLVGEARKHAAASLKIDDPRRIRMIYKGRSLKDDWLPVRELGLRSNVESEVLCIISEPIREFRADQDEDEEDESDGAESGSTAADGSSSGRRKKRSNRNRKKKKRSSAGEEGEVRSNSGTVEHLPVPSGSHPLHRPQSQSRTPTPQGSRPRSPQTPQGKLDEISQNFYATLMPDCKTFISNPPSDKGKRDFEHKRLTETIMAQVMLKLDAVETEGDEEARAKRKALVKETQSVLSKLDEVAGK